MRTLALIVSIPTLALAGMAAAAPVDPARQCPINWSEGSGTGAQCRIQPVKNEGREPFDTPEHHVMSRAEIRAELDAIKAEPAPPSSEVATAGQNARAIPSEDHER